MVPLVASDCNLPAGLLTFQATGQADGSALLNWTSQNESNLAYYVIERSANGIQWVPLTNQAPAGTGRSYTVTDPSPATGYTYYRLRLVDQTSQYTYSPVRRVGTESDLAIGIQLFPNPIHQNSLHLEYQTPTNGKILIKIYDYLGREQALLFRNVTQGNNPFYFELNNLASGVYILQIIQDQEVNQVKFVKI
jgi:hypothetical protein